MAPKQPHWLDDAVFYQVYPQSFNDSNGDGIGDINGITEKLDYIKEIGCNAIWIKPCFDSPFGDAGYDVADYYKVAPRYGTNEDLKRLFCEAHKRGMHILLDLVPGHTSVQHKWFRESMRAEKNEYPLVYVRSSGDERILVIINPADRVVSFDFEGKIDGCIYSFGEKISSDRGKIIVPAKSAGFYAI